MNELRKRALEALDGLGVEYSLEEHVAVFTMEESDALGLRRDGSVKNLFICDKPRRRFFLVTVLGNKKINLKELQDKLSAGRLGFVSEERLESMLGVKSGAVSPLGVLNDAEKKVEVVFDSCIQNLEKVGIHPNDNTATVWMRPEDLERVVRENGNPLVYIEM